MTVSSSVDPFTPVKRNNIYVSPRSGKIKKDGSPFRGGGVYSWKGPLGRYVGLSAKIQERTLNELNDANKGLRTRLGRAIRAQPACFSVGVVCQTNNPEEMVRVERECIKKKDAIRHGYNIRNGGGGGTAQALRSRGNTMTDEKATEVFRRTFKEPVWRPVLVKKGKVKNPLLPREKRQRGRIYDIMRTRSDGVRIHYIGYVTTEVWRRISSHFVKDNLRRAPNSAFYRDLHAHPSEFCVAIVPIVDELLENVSLPRLERIAIAYVKSSGDLVYNQNKGGGGGVSRF